MKLKSFIQAKKVRNMMKNKSFCAFILSHGRAQNVKTYKTLRDCGYTGEIFILLDDEDDEINKYKEIYGEEKVFVFNKDKIGTRFDTMNTWDIRNVIVFARNYCQVLARELGYDNYVQLDDDYTSFRFKYTKDWIYKESKIRCLDNVFDIYVNYINSAPIDILALMQNGDYIGGPQGGNAKNIYMRRKAMNVLFFKTKSEPIYFRGALNEDVTMYVGQGNKGKIFFSPNIIVTQQIQTQSLEGGITNVYKKYGTYVKSFFSVMIAPSCVKVSMLCSKNKRIHHKVFFKYAVPKIIREDYKKT